MIDQPGFALPNQHVAHQNAPEYRGAQASFRRTLLLVALSLLPSVADKSFAVAAESRAELSPWKDGDKPIFTLDDTERRKVALGTQSGKVVLVHFFATWCEPCREELPALRRLVERTDSKQLSVLAISVAEPDSRVRNFIENLPVNFPILLDRDRHVAKSWGVYALPTTFVLGGDLKPRLFIESDYDWDKFNISTVEKSESLPACHFNFSSRTQGATQ